MGFDKDQGPEEPIIRPRKPDTKINIWMCIFIVLFCIFAGWLLFRVSEDPPQSQESVNTPEVP